MNATRLRRLAERWKEDARVLLHRGAAEVAAIWGQAASELEKEVEAWLSEALTLREASEESGLSYSTLQQYISSGRLPNAGETGRPRIRRRDLPTKGARCPRSAEGCEPDLARQVLLNRMS